MPINPLTPPVETRTFDPMRDYLWPISSVAIQQNPSLTQNPGYNK